MSKRNTPRLRQKLVWCVAFGLVLTIMSSLYHHTVLQQHCSEPIQGEVVQCSLEGVSQGFPLAYSVPDLPKNQVRPVAFIGDWLIWSVVSVAVVWWPRKVHHG